MTDQALTGALEQATGLTPSQVTTRNECTQPPPGQASCLAVTLVSRDTGQRVHPRGAAKRGQRSTVPAAALGFAAPAGTSAPAATTPPLLGTPAYLQQAYDLTALSQSGGFGDTVGIVDAYDTPTAEQDLATYRAAFGLSPCTTASGCFRKVNENGQASPLPSTSPPGNDWSTETLLDIEAVSALCPNCHIVLVETNSNDSTDLNQGIRAAAALGANQISNSYGGPGADGAPQIAGVSELAASGDWGSYADSTYQIYPSAYPYFTSVGGTMLTPAGGGKGGRGMAESAWANWGSYNAGSGCETHFPKPSYQTDTGCAGRAYSDVSATGDPDTGLRIYQSGYGWFMEGGTSLSTPLTAAFEAITGIDTTHTAQWAYANSSLLNDPVGGTVAGSTYAPNGCPSYIAYICTAGLGYDGPTGSGSISGAVVSGAPGIGSPSVGTGGLGSSATYTSTTSSISASLIGGVYPNGLDTTYYWEYGPTSGYGQKTTAKDVGAGSGPVTFTDQLSGLAPATTYHYRLVATNAAGTTYGYDYTATTLGSGQVPPVNTSAPVLSGAPQQGQLLTVSNGLWSGGPTSYSYVWQRSADGDSTWTNITAAQSATYTPVAADVGQRLRVVVTASNAYGSGSATSNTLGPVTSGAPSNASVPKISGSPQQGLTLTVTSGSWSPGGTAYAFQWQRSIDGGQSWTNIANATSSIYVPVSADIGATLRATVTATNPYGTATAASDPTGSVASGAPRNMQAPVISGMPRQGQVVTVASTWNPAGTAYTYLWERSKDGTAWSPITNASNASYTLQVADEGQSVRVTVTAINPYGQQSVTSTAVGPVGADPPVNTAPPVVTGTTQRTYTLHATAGAWNGANNAYAYQWQRSANGSQWTAIAGQTGPAYTLAVADVGDFVRVMVTASNLDGIATQASSPTLMISPNPPQNIAAPAITGVAQRTYTLSATLGNWTAPDNAYSYQWQRDAGEGYVDIPNTNAQTYTLTAADEGAVVRAVVTASNPDGTVVEASQPTSTVLAATPVNQVAPSITGNPQRTATLSARQGTWGGLGNSYAYQWQRSADGSTWVDITGQTSMTYVVGTADEGDQVRVLVTATNPDGVSAVASAPTVTIPAAPPRNTALPTVTGTAQRATQLIAAPGTWSGIGNTYSYQWQRSTDGSTWTNIAGETAWSHTVTRADESAQLRVLVAATNPDGTVAVPSAPTQSVQGIPPINLTAPTITGTAQRGITVSASQGTWSGIDNTYAYQWQRSSGGTWSDISGATSPSYTLAVPDEGATVRVKVTATNPDAVVSATSAASWTVQASPPQNTVAPSVSGTAQRDSQLTATQGVWTGNGNKYANQWQRSTDGTTWTNIAGATAAAYQLTTADEGAKVRLLVSATNPDGTLGVASAPTAIVVGGAPVNHAPPTLTGSAQRASVLTAGPGTWSGVGNAYAYQWQRSPDLGTTWTNITGATGASYTAQKADEGSELRATVTATNADGTATASSAATAVIPSAPPNNTAVPSVSGTAQRTGILTATLGTWSGIGNVYTYQWQRDSGSGFTNITGETGTTYTVGAIDEKTRVRVLITATNPDGTASVASAPTASVLAAPPQNTAAPALTGMAERGSLLSATLGTWSGIGNVYEYQWQRSTDGQTWTNILGQSGTSYTLTVADEGAQVRVQVTATNPDATVFSASAATTIVTGSKPVNTAAPTFTGAAQRATRLAVTSNGTWTGIGNTLTRQWQRSTDNGQTWTNITGATDGLYTLDVADENAQVRLLVTATNPDGTTSVAGAPTATVAAAPPLNQAAPTVTGTPQRLSVLSASQGTWSGPDNAYAFQWQRSGDNGATWTNISAATAASHRLTQNDEGAILRVQVTASNPDGSVTAWSDPTSTVQAAPPAMLTAPSVTGTVQRTMTLTANPGTWSGPDNQYVFQWQRSTDSGASWTAITGATGAAYTLQTVDENANIRVLITVANPDGSAVTASPGTVAVQPFVPLNTAAPTIGGNARLGATLTAAAGTWSPSGATFTYQWQRSAGTSWTDIAGATSSTYTLTQSDVGASVRVILSAANVDGQASAPSARTAIVAQPPQSTSAPAAPSGTLMDSYTLTADPGIWDTQTATFSYTWLRCPVGASSVTVACTQVGSGATYKLTGDDVTHPMAVTVAATSGGGTSAAIASALTDPVVGRPLVNLSPPAISGDPQVPATLSANPGTWSVPLTGVGYTWARCDATGTACTSVWTGTSYTLTAADRGHTIMLTANAVSPGRAASASSTPLYVQDQPLPQASALPLVTGTAVRTNTLATTAGVWTNNPTSFTYQWQRCNPDGTSCQAITGATDTKYTLALADEGHAVTVTVTARNTSGTGIATAKAPGTVGAAPPVAVHPPVVKGAAEQDGTLTVVKDSAVWQDTTDTTYAAAWKRCDASGKNCQAISGATGDGYTPTSQDVDQTLVYTVTATNPDGAVTASSQPTEVVRPAAPRWRKLPLISTGPGHVGDVLSIAPGAWSGPRVDEDHVQMMRCTNQCAPAGTDGASSYTITSSDLGAILRVREYAVNGGGSTMIWSARYIGPVSSPLAGSVVLADGGVGAVRNTKGAVLATAAIQVNVATNAASIRATSRRTGRTVIVHRGRTITGVLRAWACPVATLRSGAPAPCTPKVRLRATGTLTVPASITGRLRLVVVRERH